MTTTITIIKASTALQLLLLTTHCLGLAPVHRYFVLRHGQTDANAAGIIQGSSDFSRLTDKGRQQAIQAGRAVSQHEFDAVYVSPLNRAQETLSLVRQEATLLPKETVWKDLRELDLHEWEGKKKADLQSQDPVAFKAWKEAKSFDMEVSGYKPLVDVWDRAASVWERLRKLDRAKESSTIILVCHGTLGQALLNTALGRDASYFQDIGFPNCGLVEIEWPVDSTIASTWKWHHPEPSETWSLSEWEQSQQCKTNVNEHDHEHEFLAA